MKLALLAATATAFVLQSSFREANASAEAIAEPRVRIKPTAPTDDAVVAQSQSALLNRSKASSRGSCVNMQAWKQAYDSTTPWSVFSQHEQDSVLDSLFSDQWLGTSSKSFVEFGFSFPTWSKEKRAGTGPNTQYLKFRKGWSGLLLDSHHVDASINLHKAFVTEQNIGVVFKNHGVPEDVDYVSIDIDSCDLYVFRGLISNTPYKPKVVTVEFNANHHCHESKTNKCKVDGQWYSWKHDDLYGASLMALNRVADENGYTLALATRTDAFFVKKSLVCPGSFVPYDQFCARTGVPVPLDVVAASPWERQKWLQDYPESAPSF
jgi:hypothetical protein